MTKPTNPVWEKGLPSSKMWQSAAMNERQYMFYFDWLLQLACARFKWQGLPTTIDERFMELTINSYGMSLFFFENKNYGQFFATQATPHGSINMYHEPTKFQAYGAGGRDGGGVFNEVVTNAVRTLPYDAIYRMKRDGENVGVPIWNNYTRTPTLFALEIYARRLANIDRAIDVNIAAQKMPIFITCDEAQRLTVDNMVKQWEGNEPIIIGDNMSMNGVQIGYINPDVPYVCDKLYKDKLTCWGEVMTFLGINNNSIEKGERVQSAEVNANNSQIEKSGLITLDTRRWACEKINIIFDLEVWVDSNADFSSRNFAAIMTAPEKRYDDIPD